MGLQHVQGMPQGCRAPAAALSIWKPRTRIVAKRMCASLLAKSSPCVQLRAQLQCTASVAEFEKPSWPSTFGMLYALESVVGSGEYGVVWAARSLATGASVAVKVLPKSRPDRSLEENLARIQREVELWQLCCEGTPSIVQLEGMFQDEASVYLVQQLCTGGDLKAVLQGGALSEAMAATVMQHVLMALQACHLAGVVYGDVKPANFMLAEPYIKNITTIGSSSSNVSWAEDTLAYSQSSVVVKAVDFGCSQHITECSKADKSRGSPVYMAPEVWSKTYGPACDMWAAGVMMYQLLSNRYPFWDVAPDSIDRSLPLYEIMLATCSNPICFTTPLWAATSRQAKDLIQRMLDRDPSSRITASEALQHPWFRSALGAPIQSSIVPCRLRQLEPQPA